MSDEENKMFDILYSHFGKDASKPWHLKRPTWESQICRHLDARFTAIRMASADKFYVRDPSTYLPYNTKPPRYIEMDRLTAIKILALGELPSWTC